MNCGCSKDLSSRKIVAQATPMPLFFFDQKSKKDKFDLDETVAKLYCSTDETI
jgi:hypothetical protein